MSGFAIRSARERRVVASTLGVVISLALALATAGMATAGEFQYVGVKKCRSCHKKELIGDQIAKWKEGKHAAAFDSLASDKALEYAKEKGIEGSPQKADECLKCHVTAFDADPASIKNKLSAADGVQCESCHGPGSRYRKKKIMADEDKAIANGLIKPTEKHCITCHNDESPAWNPERYTLANGSKVGFDFAQASEKISHPIPEEVKGHYLEMEKKAKAERMAGGEAVEDDEEDD